MSQITMTGRSRRLALRDRFQPDEDARQAAADSGETLRSPPYRRSTAFPEPRHDRASRSPVFAGGRADECVARVLLIERDPRLIWNQLRQAFPAPLHEVHVVASGDEG